jgi:hypothetical protein
MADTPLKDVPAWTDEYVERLGKSWITTAEQVVALSVTEGGLRSLAEQLGASEVDARRLVEAARAALPPGTRAEMEKPVDTREYGLGVRWPRDEGRGQ